MKTIPRASKRYLVPALAAAALALALIEPQLSVSQTPASSGSKFQFPYIPKNARRPISLIRGDTYTPKGPGVYLIQGLTIHTFQYRSNGMVTNFMVEAPTCLLDTRQRIASSPGEVTARTADGSIRISGTNGFVWRQKESRLIISNHVFTALDRALIIRPGKSNDR